MNSSVNNLQLNALIIPCYKVSKHILNVLENIGPEINYIFVIDDNCPENTGDLVKKKCSDQRVKVIRNEKNLGVGGSSLIGFKEAFKNENIDICIKIDGDNQMDPENIKRFINIFKDKKNIYVKGNRFHFHKEIFQMPFLRFVGNFFLSLLSKFTTGQYNSFDVTNGFISINRHIYNKLDLTRISNNFFFETSLIAATRLIKCNVVNLKISTIYRDEKSNLLISKIFLNFIINHFKIFYYRINYEYFRGKKYFMILVIINIFISILLSFFYIKYIYLFLILIIIFLMKDIK